MTRPVIVALHGVGSTDDQMQAALVSLESVAEVVALAAPQPFDGGGTGRQWFSVSGITEENRAARTAAALDELLPRLDKLAATRDLPRHELILLGFSQGAILTLSAVASGAHHGRAVAIAGRLTTNPIVVSAEQAAAVLLVHDADDQMMPSHLSLAAAGKLAEAGHLVETRSTSGVQHSIGLPTVSAISDWLRQDD